MIMMYFLFAPCLIICRFFAGYDSRYQNGRYIVINNPKLRRLLIDETSFFERRKRHKNDINKMTVLGLILYIYSLVTLVLSILLHIIVPPIPVEPWEIETDRLFVYADTLNEKIVAICIWLFFLSVIACMAFLMSKYIKKAKQKWIKILTYVTCSTMLAAVAFMLFETIKELVMCLIK